MLNNIKAKLWVALTSPRIGNLIITYFIKNGFINTSAGFVKVGSKASKPISLIFWGLYEREDIYFIKNHLPKNIPVIELGASLGVTTTQICKKVGTKTKVVSVEANPNLFSSLLETKEKNKLYNLEIISAAIDYSGNSEISFSVNESTLSSSKSASDLNTTVSTIQLSKIIKDNHFSEYSLVCDIEGAEIELLLCEKNKDVVSACKTIIIELHTTHFEDKTYQIKELSNMFKQKFSMEIVAQKGTTFVFNKV
ncbi:FkbM family methyltransferase [Pedobacter sp. SD-b]|uniref:FkbM family methyltransferase n=1 Tax=Pedobacter segetis TaxID=2793069 RepID=A0ABS1BGZ3_9SPHI|nr:FkbM family methyltransferase [Pedobacter segetis]MBK0382056.1 FkbM family methyltransferase [Pedobacter segetis]